MIKPLINLFKQSNIVENNYKLDDEIVIISSIMEETDEIDGEIDTTDSDYSKTERLMAKPYSMPKEVKIKTTNVFQDFTIKKNFSIERK